MEFKEYKIDDSLQLGPFVYKIQKRYIYTKNGNNSAIFDYLNIPNKYNYIKQILGYIPAYGDFPEADTIEDLNKVIKQLQIDCLIKEAK